MVKRLTLILLILSSFRLLSQIPVDSSQYKTDYYKLYEQFAEFKIDPNNVRRVSGLIVDKDAGEFILTDGILAPFFYNKNRNMAFLFVGEGSFWYTPASRAEKENLKRFTGVDSFRIPVKSLLVLVGEEFVKTAYTEIIRLSEKEIKSLERELEEHIGYVVNTNTQSLHPNFARAALNDNLRHYFFSLFFLPNDRAFAYQCDPFENEDMAFYRAVKSGGERKLETINNFLSENFQRKRFEYKSKLYKDIKVVERTVDVYFDESLRAKCRAKFVVESDANFDSWRKFDLLRDLKIDSIRDNNGNRIHYYRPRYSEELWIKMPRIAKSLQFYYGGDLIYRKPEDIIEAKSKYLWRPVMYNDKKSNATLTFIYPDRYALFASGEKYSEKNEAGKIISVWKTNNLRWETTFSIGEYIAETIIINERARVNLNLLKNKSALSEKNKTAFKSAVKQMAEFYYSAFGYIPFRELNINEIDENERESSQSLIYLNFDELSSLRDLVFYTASEFSKQWFGKATDYRNEWLYEGNALYCGLLFAENYFNNSDFLFSRLSDWRDDLIKTRKNKYKQNYELDELNLGYRSAALGGKKSLDLIVYKKAAWIMHMLRYSFIDIATLNDGSFFEFQKDFIKMSNDREVQKEDLLYLISEYAGEDMRWFISNWVDETVFPEYVFSYKQEINKDGLYLIKCRIKQVGDSWDLRMQVPLRVEYSDNRFSRIKVRAQGDTYEFYLPVTPLKPKKVVFNDLLAVLCSFKYESWRE